MAVDPLVNSRKEERLDVRLRRDAKQLIASAAALSHQSLSEFVVSVAIERSREVIERASAFQLNQQQASHFLDALTSPPIPNVKLRDFVIDLADEMGIPLQLEVLSGYGEDGAQMQRAYGGAPTVNLTIPTRYLHNHNGVIHRDDFDRAVELITELVRRLDQTTVDRIKSFD